MEEFYCLAVPNCNKCFTRKEQEGRIDYVVEIIFDDVNPKLTTAKDEKGRDIYVYSDDLDLRDFKRMVYDTPKK